MIKIKLLNILIIFALFCIFTDTSFSLEALSKEKMKTTTGQRALTNITTNDTTTRLFINTHIETFTEIESLKLAYFDRNGTIGWDQNWNNLSFGTQDTNLTIDGLVIKADFVNLESSEPVLKRFIIGSNMLNGSISGNFDSFTGTYNPKLLDPNSTDSAQVHIRQSLNSGNTTTFNFDSSSENQGFFLILSPEAVHNGIHAVLGFSEGNAPNITDVSPWWNAP